MYAPAGSTEPGTTGGVYTPCKYGGCAGEKDAADGFKEDFEKLGGDCEGPSTSVEGFKASDSDFDTSEEVGEVAGGLVGTNVGFCNGSAKGCTTSELLKLLAAAVAPLVL